MREKNAILLFICMAFLFCGCQMGEDEHQITVLEETYLSSEASKEPSEQTDKAPQTDRLTRVDEPKQTKEPPQQRKKSTQKTASPKKKEPSAPEKIEQNAGQQEQEKEKIEKETQNVEQEEKTPEPEPSAELQTSKPKKNTLVKSIDSKKEHRTEEKNEKKLEPTVEPTEPTQTLLPSDIPAEQQNVEYCTISIECKSILEHLEDLKESKRSFVPDDGVILEDAEVMMEEGDSVYDILYRVCREKNIHIEAKYTPAYRTYYVEGIHQLYEFDCGSLSGWMYLVNDQKPNYGCSSYFVEAGDRIQWTYTCDG